MPSTHPTAKPLFAPTLLALSLASSLAVWGGPADAAQRHWTYIGGCDSADWFGMTSGLNAQGQSTCWAASSGGQSGELTPSINDDVFIQNPSGTQDVGITFSIPNDPSRRGYANVLTISGTNGRFSQLTLGSGELKIDGYLTVGRGGKGKFTQTGGRLVADSNNIYGSVLLGSGAESIGRYELTAGQADLWRIVVGAEGGYGELVQTGGTLGTRLMIVGELGGVGSNPASSLFDISGGSATINELYVGSTKPYYCASNACGGGRARIRGTASVQAESVVVGDTGLLLVEGGTLSVTVLDAAPNNLGFSGGTIEFTGAATHLTEGSPSTLSFGGGFGSGTPTVRLANNTTLGLSQIHVGEFGKGKLELMAGARLTSSTATLGKGKYLGAGDGEAVVAGAGASWTNTDRLDVGLTGLGILKVQAGGSLTTGVAYLGDTAPDAARGRNSVTVDGAGSRWQNNGDLVAGGGDATTGQASDVKLVNGGRLDNAGTLTIRPGSAMYFEGGGSLSAAETINQSLIDVGLGGTATLAGSLYLESGSLLSVQAPLTTQGPVVVAAGARIENSNYIRFEGAVALRSGALVSGDGAKVFAGGLSVGDSPGVFVDNSTDALVFLADTNTYLAEIGGTDIGSFDRYVLNGILRLGGTLKLISWAGYTAQAGASFDLFDGTLSGSFASIDTSSFALDPGLSWDFSQLGSTGVLSITVTPIPEPGTWALWLGGLAVLGGLARRRMPRARATAQV